jgi:hypothetical protein
MTKKNKKADKATSPLVNALSALPTHNEKGRPRLVRIGSQTNPVAWAKIQVQVAQQLAAAGAFPCDPDGTTWVPQQGASGGMTAEQRAIRASEKQAEEARLASMTEEERLAYAAEKRKARRAKRQEREAAKKAALIAQVKAEMEAGNDPLETLLK